jgi:hypothetical protein
MKIYPTQKNSTRQFNHSKRKNNWGNISAEYIRRILIFGFLILFFRNAIKIVLLIRKRLKIRLG